MLGKNFYERPKLKPTGDQTDVIAFSLGAPHLPPQVRIDGQHKDLHEGTTIERNCIEINCLGFVVNCRLPRNGITYDAIRDVSNAEETSLTRVQRNVPEGISLNR